MKKALKKVGAGVPSANRISLLRDADGDDVAESEGNSLPPQFASGMFVGQHGSWNRKPRSSYNVVFVPFSHGKPSGNPVEVLTGFVNAKGEANGRPVGVAIDKRGALLVADDVGNAIWRITAQADH